MGTLRDLRQRGHPHVAAGGGVLDQQLQRGHPRCPPGQERVRGQDEHASLVGQRVQFARPKIQHLCRRLDHDSDIRLGQKRVLFPIVEHPVHRQLGQRAMGCRQQVGPVVVHQARVEAEAVLGKQVGRAIVQLPPGSAEAGGSGARDPLQARDAPFQLAPLLAFVHAVQLHM